jgi:hypothetical protein
VGDGVGTTALLEITAVQAVVVVVVVGVGTGEESMRPWNVRVAGVAGDAGVHMVQKRRKRTTFLTGVYAILFLSLIS